MRILLLIILLLPNLFGQSVVDGSVILELPLESPSGQFGYDFVICCGEIQPQTPLNVFSIHEGKLNLAYKNPSLPQSYQVTGSLVKWLPPTIYSANCMQYGATFDDVSVVVSPGKTVTGLTGVYSQLVCHASGVDWNSGGAITVF
jgi:hypothetical protein